MGKHIMMRIAAYTAMQGSSLELHSKVTQEELAKMKKIKQERKAKFQKKRIPGLVSLNRNIRESDGLTKAERIKLQLQGIRTGKD